MDFKIGEDIQEENNNSNNNKKLFGGNFNIIIIVVVALVAFLVVFLIANAIFNPKQKKVEPVVPTSEKLSLTENNVKILYQYVTYGTKGIRNDKFIKNKSVKLKDFTDEEIYYYALQFAQVEDFDFTGNVDENNNKIYTITSRTVKKYVERYFGKNVKYSTDLVITYPFSFSINGKSVGILKYNEETDSYDTVFTEETKEDELLIEPYAGKLIEAYKEPDGGYKLVEKVIFINTEKQEDGKYKVIISKDYEGNNVIESSVDQTEEDIKKIKVNKYINKGATVTYNFKLNSNVLYFDSSEIK